MRDAKMVVAAVLFLVAGVLVVLQGNTMVGVIIAACAVVPLWVVLRGAPPRPTTRIPRFLGGYRSRVMGLYEPVGDDDPYVVAERERAARLEEITRADDHDR